MCETENHAYNYMTLPGQSWLDENGNLVRWANQILSAENLGLWPSDFCGLLLKKINCVVRCCEVAKFGHGLREREEERERESSKVKESVSRVKRGHREECHNSWWLFQMLVPEMSEDTALPTLMFDTAAVLTYRQLGGIVDTYGLCFSGLDSPSSRNSTLISQGNDLSPIFCPWCSAKLTPSLPGSTPAQSQHCIPWGW